MSNQFEKEIDLYYAPTPNGYKVEILLEELGIPYKIHPINISKGEQFTPEFLKISPNNRIPAIVDPNQLDAAGNPISIFESGAILIYFAQKTGKLLPDALTDPAGNAEVLQWVMWQMGGIGPMFGQYNHFFRYATEKYPYAIERYRNESNRLLRVMDTQLAKHPYLASSGYSIADIICIGWIFSADFNKLFEIPPNVRRWFDEILQRPVLKKLIPIYIEKATANQNRTFTDEERKVLFGQK